MAIHLLATVNSQRKVVREIDFHEFLSLSEGQTVIIESCAALFFGNRLPGRYVIVVGTTTSEHMVADEAVSTMREAVQLHRQSGNTDAVMVGFSRMFNALALAVADCVHLNDVEPEESMCADTHFPQLPSEKWELVNMHITPPSIWQKTPMRRRGCYRRLDEPAQEVPMKLL